METIQIFQHFPKDEEEDGAGDYLSVTVDVDSVRVVHFGDSYHDNGNDKAAGFVEAIVWLNPDIHVLPKGQRFDDLEQVW